MEIYVDRDRVFVSFGKGPFLEVTEAGVQGERFIPDGDQVYDSGRHTAHGWTTAYDAGHCAAQAEVGLAPVTAPALAGAHVAMLDQDKAAKAS